MYPTHAIIDKATHSIDEVKVVENSAHTHRVFFNCPLKFDVRGEHQFVEHAVKKRSKPDVVPAPSKTIKELEETVRKLHVVFCSFVDENGDGPDLATNPEQWRKRDTAAQLLQDAQHELA